MKLMPMHELLQPAWKSGYGSTLLLYLETPRSPRQSCGVASDIAGAGDYDERPRRVPR